MSGTDETDDTLVAPAGHAGAPGGAGPSLPPSAAAEPWLAGRYELLGLLGTGGMGAVYRVRDVELGEEVALKMLRAELGADAQALERFRQEVRLARRVTHKNVARTFDIGEHRGAKFLTMELVDGVSLGARLAERGALPPGEVVELTTAVCAGLAAAHDAGVVHRDLKPENVLIARDGRVVVTDFGIAHAHAAHDASSTSAGMIIGTPSYMAPEQMGGEGAIDARADVYALGAVIFEMLTGRRAWIGDTPMDVLRARLSAVSPPDALRGGADVDPGMAAVVVRCMAPRPDDRFGRVDEVALALRAARGGSRERARPVALGDPSPAPGALVFRTRFDAPDAGLRRARSPGTKTVAVLPLANLGPADDQFVADGLTDDLIDTLSMIRGLRVRPRSAVERFLGRDDAALEIGRELGVQVIVHGSVRRQGDAVRFGVRVTGTADGFQLWAKRFDATVSELLVASEDAARAIAHALTTELPEQERAALTDPAAVELYLRAKSELWRSWHASGRVAAELFNRALTLAPDDPKILAGAATARVRMMFFGEGPRDEVLARASELTERAVALAPELGDTWAALAGFRLNTADSAGAARALAMGLAHAPQAAMLEDMLGRMLAEAGAIEAGCARLAVALELDPSLMTARTELARARALLGEWDRAGALLDAVLPGQPSVTRDAYRARIALWRGGPAFPTAAAPDTYVRVICDALSAGGLSEAQLAFLRRTADKATARLRPFVLQVNAELYTFAGDLEAAFEALGQAVDADLIDVAWLDRCPVLAPLRDDPRWAPIRAAVSTRCARILDALGEALTPA